MAFRRTTDGTEDDLPNYIRKALGKDRSWMQEALCRTHDLRKAHAWTVSIDDRVRVGATVVPGSKLISAALIVCKACPQQWLCGLWALDVDERVGTWAMPFKDLAWLKKQPSPEGVIHMARIAKVPVQVAVRRARGGEGVASSPCSPLVTPRSPGSNLASSRTSPVVGLPSTGLRRRSGRRLNVATSIRSTASPTPLTKRAKPTSSPASPSTSSETSVLPKKTPSSISA